MSTSNFSLLLQGCYSWLFSRSLPCTILSRQPVIIAAFWEDFCKEKKSILATLPEAKSSYGFFQLGWEYESTGLAESVAAEVQQLRLHNPHFYPIFLTNTQQEQKLFEAQNLRALFVQHNVFLDEARYEIISTKPSFDAIYIARITPFKRHYLANKINSLYLIGDYSLAENEFALKALADLSHATWVRKVWGPRIKYHIAKAHIGLCLSKAEGAMFVSAEYLLCGKPLISTRSLGGRDALFDPAHTYIVDDNSEDVAAAVKKAIVESPPPQQIRKRTLEIMSEHRIRFINELQRIFDETGVAKSAQSEWSNIFVHKLGVRCKLHPFVSLHRRLRANSRL